MGGATRHGVIWSFAGVLAGLALLSLAADTAPSSKDWRHEYAAFRAMPPEAQERIRRIDRELREEDSVTQARLLVVMQRYGEWLDRLSPEQRRHVEGATSVDEKIRRIHEVREQQWIATLPEADRNEIKDLKGEQRRERIAAIRERERQRETEWQMSLARSGDRQEMIRQEVLRWANEVFPKLSPEDRKRLREAQMQGNPAAFRTLVELARKYSVPPPPGLQKMRLPQLEYPRVPDRKLLQFLRGPQISDVTRREFETRLRDAEQREQALADLVELYWQSHADELRRIREEDEQKRSKKRPAKPGGV